ncbi:hypothetical protein Tco_0871408 [Tanacetum coccineum]
MQYNIIFLRLILHARGCYTGLTDGGRLRKIKWNGLTTERLLEDLESAYNNAPNMFSIRIHHGGTFQRYPGRRLLTSQDKGLYALACEEDVRCVATLDRSFKLIEVYKEHDVTVVDSYRRPPPWVRATI